MTSDARMPEASEPAAELAEELVAYLDGELDSAQAQQVENRLARDAVARRDLQRLEQVWDALEQLPRTPAGEDFAHSTVEIVAQTASEDLATTMAGLPKQRRRRWWYKAAAIGASLVVGFIVVRSLAPDPNQALLENLPVVESLDEYRAVQDVDFLRGLENRKLFAEEATHGQP